MSELSMPIGILFGQFPGPVLLLESDRIRYRNPAAEAQFPELAPGTTVPEAFAALPEDGSALLTWRERSWQVSVQTWEGQTLLRMTRPQSPAILPDDRVPVLVQKLRGPLTTLLSSRELLAELLTPEQRKTGNTYLARSAKAQLRLLRLLRSLELAALPEEIPPYDFHPEPLDLRGLVNQAYRELTGLVEQAGCSITLEAQPGNYLVRCDDELLLIQLYHLISNALRATGPGGHLLLRLEHTRRLILVSVEDNGPGLTPLELSQLFDPTQGGDTLQTAGAGLGLGITVCQKIAQLHQGSLLFANRKNGGVRATISLPLLKDSDSATLCTPPRLADSSNGFALVLRELSDVLPDQCFLPEDL